MTSSKTESSLGPAAPADLVAALANTLDVMVDQPLAGRILFGEDPPTVGRYAIEARLGAGATAVVYAARDTTLDRSVALKIVNLRDVTGAWRERVLREARALACLSHPNVVAVYDVDEWRGHPFIVMELVSGQTLAQWQARTAEPPTCQAILRHYLAAGRGLEAAHSAGFVHRDFKPANVLVADSGRVVVTDFGLAALAEAAAGSSAVSAGTKIGTPAYLAPEQRTGVPPHPSADVYSFSVALCEALAGRHPGSDGPSALEPISLPRCARAAIKRGMDPDPARRWSGMGPLLDAIEAALPPPLTKLARPPRRRAARAAFVVALGLGVALTAEVARRTQLTGDGRAGPISIATARGLVEDDPTAAARLLLEVPASQRGSDWIDLSRAALLRPIARELRCLDGPPSSASVAHGLFAAVDAGGRAILCELATEQVLSLTDHAICTRVVDADHVAVLTADDDLAVFTRGPGWRSARRFSLGPLPPGAPRPDSPCDQDLLPTGAHTLALHRGGAWRLVDLDAPGSILEAGAHVPLAVSADRHRALVRSARGDLAFASLAALDAPSAPIVTPLSPPIFAAHDPTSGIAVTFARYQSESDPIFLRIAQLAGYRTWNWALTAMDLGTGAVIGRESVAFDIGASTIAVAPGGRVAVAGNHDGMLLWWTLAGDAREARRESLGRGAIAQLAFNRAGTRLAWRDSFGGIGVQGVGRASSHELPFGGRPMCHVTFATDNRVVGVSCEGRALAWDLAEQRMYVAGRHDLGHCMPDCGSASSAIWSASVAPDGSVVATAGWEGTVGIWPLQRDAPGPVRLPIGLGRRTFTTLFAGDRLLVANRDAVAQIWNWRTGALVADLPGHGMWSYPLAQMHRSPGPATFVTGSRGEPTNSSAVRFWSEAGALLAEHPTSSSVIDLASSPSGRLVAAGLSSGEVLVLDAATSGQISRTRAHSDWARRVAFLDEATVISAGGDGVVQQIAIPFGEITATLRGHTGPIYDLDVRGDSLLTASHDATVRLWDARRGVLVRTYLGHKDPVVVVRWHAGGERFVSGVGNVVEHRRGEARACVWQVERDTCQDWLIGHSDDIRAAQFIDDARVMTASFDGTVRIWTPLGPATAEQLAAELDRRVPACLDERQRRSYLGESEHEAFVRARACRREPRVTAER